MIQAAKDRPIEARALLSAMPGKGTKDFVTCCAVFMAPVFTLVESAHHYD
jgi:hypothetical protein